MKGISRQTDYAARLVLHLATLEPGQLASIAEVAARRLLPEPFLRRIVRRLADSGLVATVRGAGGGVRLARRAGEISLLDVVRAIEGGVELNRCVDDPQSCPLTDTCPVQREWTRVTRELEAELGAIRFSDLATDLEQRVSAEGHPSGGRTADVVSVQPLGEGE